MWLLLLLQCSTRNSMSMSMTINFSVPEAIILRIIVGWDAFLSVSITLLLLAILF
jgi:hypothetical protein